MLATQMSPNTFPMTTPHLPVDYEGGHQTANSVHSTQPYDMRSMPSGSRVVSTRIIHSDGNSTTSAPVAYAPSPVTHTTVQRSITPGPTYTSSSNFATATYQPKDCVYVSSIQSLKFGMHAPYDIHSIPTYEAPLVIGAPPFVPSAATRQESDDMHVKQRSISSNTGVSKRSYRTRSHAASHYQKKTNICGC